MLWETIWVKIARASVKAIEPRNRKERRARKKVKKNS
jgi:hypothetical protein